MLHRHDPPIKATTPPPLPTTQPTTEPQHSIMSPPTDTITSHVTSLPSTLTTSPRELERILGKCVTTPSRKRSRPPSNTVSWAKEWTYHPHVPWTPDNTLGGSSQSSPDNHTSSTLHPRHNHTRKAQLLSGIHTHVPWPKHITRIITSIISLDIPPPDPPEFTFELTREAALRNFCILQRYNGDIGTAIAHQLHTPLGYGSEFRPVNTLEKLLHLHPHWCKFKQLLTTGSDWPLDPISDADRRADINAALKFGNHKEAIKNPTLLKSLVLDDVTHGFALPLPLEKIHRLQGILLAPMNIATQDTIDEHGDIIPKRRLTHDQSYILEGSGTSVNSRTDKTKLTPCIFGWVIRRLCHWIVCARRKHPGRRIFATKLDFKSAYRRCHLHHATAAQSCAQLPDDEIALLMLRLTFGGTPCPHEWSVISETICDLATAILIDDDWDCSTLFSPQQHLIPSASFLPDDIPFGEGKDLIVNIDINDRGTHEMYLDDLIGLGIDIEGTDNITRAERAPMLAIHTCARPVHHNEPIPRQDMVSLNKLRAEAALTEIKTILGWVWDLRRLIISLPETNILRGPTTFVRQSRQEK